MTAKMAERVGLFGGSFDPVHFGHLILAREALEELGLDRVVWIPAGVSPFKLEAPPVSAEVRLEMVRAAVAGEPRFVVEDWEVRRGGASFTIDTVRELQGRAEVGVEWFYFIGDDNLADLEKWREIAELRRRVQFVVLTRHEAVAAPEWALVVRRQIDISSTEVRNRVACGRSIQYLCPESVCEMIRSRRLYCDG